MNIKLLSRREIHPIFLIFAEVSPIKRISPYRLYHDTIYVVLMDIIDNITLVECIIYIYIL